MNDKTYGKMHDHQVPVFREYKRKKKVEELNELLKYLSLCQKDDIIITIFI